jgi:GPI ethanolamine phosphate transferase 3 subunit O
MSSSSFPRGQLTFASSNAPTPTSKKDPPSTVRKPTDLAILKFICILIFFITLHITGIYFFTRGFLLTRLVLDAKSTCSHPPVPLSPLDRGECWYPAQFQKAIIIVIDALRYDFTVPFPPEKAEWYHNAFTTPFEIARERPENAFLTRFIADPPTTTLQRLKGLTTGSLPTFIDAGSNFAGTAIDEDNLISQLHSAGRRIAFLGDDTWTSLFPWQFSQNMTFPFESFNVWDLHTLDNGVLQHLMPLVQQPEKWDVLIAHFLGVDHAGHRYGPNHEAMNEKLKQMDYVIATVMESVEDDTLLVVMGDHGMDAKGDHGGDSPGEVEAALWMYSKRPAFGRLDHHGDRSVAQIDLVPTLSLLLGLPIPFNNLGGPIPNTFLRENTTYKPLASAARVTAGQIRRYQEMYKESGKVDLGPQFAQQWGPAEDQWAVMQTWSDRRATPEWEAMYQTFRKMQDDNLTNCRRLWARFDPESMIAGVAILLGSIAALGGYLGLVVVETVPDEVPFFSWGMVGGMVRNAGFLLVPVFVKFGGCLWAAAALTGGAIGFVGDAWRRLRHRFGEKHFSAWDYLSITVTVVHAAIFTSNSFTIWEDQIMHFLLTTISITLVISTLRQQSSPDKVTGTMYAIIFTVLVRIAAYSQLCREEQMPYCRTTFYASESSSVSSPSVLGALVINSMLLPAVIKFVLARRGWYQGSAKEWIGIGMPCLLALSSGYWIWDTATNNAWYGLQDNISQKYLARFILLTSLFAATGLYMFGPMCMDIESSPGVNLGNLNDPTGRNRLQLRITGYENAMGTVYLLFVLSAYIAISFVAKPMGGVSLAILVSQIILLLEILDINNLSTSSIGITTFFLLANSHFFTTGHQATLPSIQWDAAFIPFVNIIYPWSPLVVIVNSFGSHILIALAIPLLALWNHHPTENDVLARTATVVTTFLLQQTVVTTSSVIFAAYFRRHLMVWKIFGPRYMVAGIVLLVTDLVVLLGGVGWGFWLAVVNVGAITTRIERLRNRT